MGAELTLLKYVFAIAIVGPSVAAAVTVCCGASSETRQPLMRVPMLKSPSINDSSKHALLDSVQVKVVLFAVRGHKCDSSYAGTIGD